MVSGTTGSSSSGSSSSASTTSLPGIGNGLNGTYGVIGQQASNPITFSGLASGINTSQIIQEMLTIDRLPEQPLVADQQVAQNKMNAYNALSAQLIGLQATVFPLNGLRSFNLVTATTANPNVATVTAQTGAQTGTHTLSVSQLATAQLVSAAPQASQSAPLGITGSFLVNGKTVNVTSSDSLQTLASNINAVQGGVTASILSPSANQFYLTIGSNNSGVQGTMSLADSGNSTVLSQLGITGTTASISHVLTGTGGGAGSNLFSDSATPVNTLLGQQTAAAGTVTINLSGGQSASVNINLGQSLTDIAASINSAFGSSVANVQTVNNPITNTNQQQLQITGATGFTDSNNVLADLGLYQANIATGRTLTQAQDAKFTLDGISATRATNSFSDAISGVTINLLQDATSSTTGTAPTTTFTVSPDTKTIQSNIDAFAKAYNSTIDLMNNFTQFNTQNSQTGALFGDSLTESIQNQMGNLASGQIAGLPTSMSALSQAGMTMDQYGHLVVDDTALGKALTSNLQGVANLFQANGQPSDSNVQFVSSTAQTQPSSSAGYSVQISQPATQASYTTAVAQTSPTVAAESLTFQGSLFGSSNIAPGGQGPLSGPTINVPVGSTAADIVSLINSNTAVSSQLSASLNSTGNLTLTSKLYGSSAAFQVVSSAAAASNTSGIGNTVLAITGQDVQGTINGEPATGNGQYLTGSMQGVNGSGNGQALGLELRVTATQAGSYGNVVYTSGVANQINNMITNMTDPSVGLITVATQNLQTQYNNDQTNINQIEANITLEQQTLQLQFTAMEQAIATLQANSAGLSALSSSGSATSSTTGSSASSATTGSTGTSSTGTSSTGTSSTGTPPGG